MLKKSLSAPGKMKVFIRLYLSWLIGNRRVKQSRGRFVLLSKPQGLRRREMFASITAIV